MSATTRVIGYESTAKSGHSVEVTTDPDLGMKLRKGEIFTSDHGSFEVAMVIGVDESETDVMQISDSPLSIRERLECIKAAVDLALEGYPQ